MIGRSIFLTLTLLWFSASQAQSAFTKSEFYNALGSNDLSRLEQQITAIQKYTGSNAVAYLGALNMKKAGLLREPGEKLKLFKKGHLQLEESIRKDSLNPELRFLRLMIQENSPKILNYHGMLSEDAAYLRSHYRKLDEKARKALYQYSLTSKVISTKDLEERHD